MTAVPATTDERSGFCIRNDLPLYDLSEGNLARKDGIALGEKLLLLGRRAKASPEGTQPEGKQGEYILVKRESGQEGWALPEYIVAKSSLGVVVAQQAVVYTEPKNAAATARALPKLTVAAVHLERVPNPFLRITAYDAETRILHAGVFLRREDVSLGNDEVRSAILAALTARSRDRAPTEAAIETEPFPAILAANSDGVGVRSHPGESAGKLIASLAKGQKVEVEEKTRENDDIGAMSAPWYRIREPAGWVYGVYLEVER